MGWFNHQLEKNSSLPQKNIQKNSQLGLPGLAALSYFPIWLMSWRRFMSFFWQHFFASVCWLVLRMLGNCFKKKVRIKMLRFE